MRQQVLALSFAICVALAGCGEERVATLVCGPDAPCTGGLVCVDQQCRACRATADCPSGLACVGGVCGACSSSEQCDGGICRDGTCGRCASSEDCTFPKECIEGSCATCTANEQCGSGRLCIAGACVGCSDDEECGHGQSCLSDARCGICSEKSPCAGARPCRQGECFGCASDAECAEGLSCLSNGNCGACSPNQPCRAGGVCREGRCGPCGTSDECPGQLSCLENGACGRCSEEYPCADGNVCVEGVCGPCTESSECAENQVCRLDGTCGPCALDEECAHPQTCGGGGVPGLCGCRTEAESELCARLGKNCDTVSAADRCGVVRTVSCGSCTNPQTCGGDGRENVCGCVETDEALCARLGRNCDLLTAVDRCGATRTVNCGTCEAPLTCGGAGTANRCGCAPESEAAFCARLGKDCELVTGADACGVLRTVNCGRCTAPETCGGAGSANECACPPETDAAFCSRLGKNCGSVSAADNCGAMRTASCGTCGATHTCGGGGTQNVCGCAGETDAAFCGRLGKDCGLLTATDGCGTTRTVSCGSCAAPKTCGGGGTDNVCACSPETNGAFCSRLGKNCGSVTAVDNCGASRTVSCGTCTAPATCGGGGAANVCECTRETDAAFCTRLGKNCGTLTAVDSCGVTRTASCGSCTSPQSCGGSGTANVCGCTTETNTAFCARLGKNCGSVTATDNCGASRTTGCGTCPDGKSCGGGGIANVCECAPETNPAFCARLGKNCGSVTAADDCGASRTTDCGTCTSPLVCAGSGTANVCECLAESDTAFCTRLGKNCGSLTANDNCGVSRTATCGTCTSPQTCGGGGAANVCACAPESNAQFCARLGKNCDFVTAPDACGVSRQVDCGSCTSPSTCGGGGAPNVCGGCGDGIKNGSETDVDCGGTCAAKCADGKTCGVNTDCLSQTCLSGRCVTAFATLRAANVVAAGGFSLAVALDGRVWGAGTTSCGVFKDGTAASRTWQPMRKSHLYPEIMSGLKSVHATDAPSTACFGIAPDERLWVIGYNTHGAYGGGASQSLTAWQQTTTTGAARLTTGATLAPQNTSFLLKSDGTLWGAGRTGRVTYSGYNKTSTYDWLGVGSHGSYVTGASSSREYYYGSWAQVRGPDGNPMTGITAADRTGLALLSDGTVWARSSITITTGSTYNPSTGAYARWRYGNIDAVQKLFDGGIAQKSNGTLWWSRRTWSAAAGGGSEDSVVWEALPALPGSTDLKDASGEWTSASSHYAFVLKTDGTLWATGKNTSGWFGTGVTTDSYGTWKQLPVSGVASMSVNERYGNVLVVKVDGTVWAAGTNTNGMLGDGTVDAIMTWKHVE